MKSIKALALVALAALSISAIAAPKDKKTKKTKEAAAKVDTLSLADFSYQYGKVNTNGLKTYLAQRMGIDTTLMADFMEGFNQAEMTEADKKVKAKLTGMEIRQQVENQILPQCNKRLNDSIDMIPKEIFLNGFRDGVMGTATDGISMDSANALVRKQLDYYQEQKYAPNIQAGKEFLAKNAKEKDVVTLPSGLQYKVITEGTGDKPTATSRVKVNYRGTLLDGTEFDSSYKRNKPATFGVGQVIKGWSEGLQLMPVGSKYMFYVPQELGYGSRESGSIPPFSTLIFEVELVEIVK